MRMLVALALLLAAVPLHAQSAGACGDLEADAGGYGPWDYTDGSHRRQKIPVIEDYHFTPKVENLRGGESGYIGSDLDYTLRHVPNHHRALHSTLRYAIREGTPRPPNMRYAMECWFERAKRFAPKDGVVWMLHGMYEHKRGNLDKAVALAEEGLERSPGNPNIHYNLGLLYFRAERFDAALEQAHAAYGRGFPLAGLRELLKSAGHWEAASP